MIRDAIDTARRAAIGVFRLVWSITGLLIESFGRSAMFRSHVSPNEERDGKRS